jgi:hypothetical protein
LDDWSCRSTLTPITRRADRVLAMVGELHRRGYQKLRVMPFMNSSGTAWRCWIGPDTLFYRNHGAYSNDDGLSDEPQTTSLSARYTTGADHFFDWQDADHDDARTLADKFLARFTELAKQGEGCSYAYAGWYQRLLGLAERGWMPVVIDDSGCSTKTINLYDLRPAEWRTGNGKKPSLPLPPAGKSEHTIELHGPSSSSPTFYNMEEFEQKQIADKVVWQRGFDDAVAGREKQLDAEGKASFHYFEGYAVGEESRASVHSAPLEK